MSDPATLLQHVQNVHYLSHDSTKCANDYANSKCISIIVLPLIFCCQHEPWTLRNLQKQHKPFSGSWNELGPLSSDTLNNHSAYWGSFTILETICVYHDNNLLFKLIQLNFVFKIQTSMQGHIYAIKETCSLG